MAAPAASSKPVNNALFLVGLGIFFSVVLLPLLFSMILRFLSLLALMAVAAAASNPDQYAFARWLQAQDHVGMDPQAGVGTWLKAAVQTAMNILRDNTVTWTYYNLRLFGVIHVPALQRYAFGCFGLWFWVGQNSPLLGICEAEWVRRLTRGGTEAAWRADNSRTDGFAIRKHQKQHSSLRHRGSGGGVSKLESAATSFLSSMNELSSPVVTSSGAGGSRVTGVADRELRSKAIQAKIKKDWKTATKCFEEAAAVAMSVLCKSNYRLEAAWCSLELMKSYDDARMQLVKRVDDISEELASGGFFEDAARAQADLVLRLKRRFPEQLQNDVVVKEWAQLFLKAKSIAEAGGFTRLAIDYTSRAAILYAQASFWSHAEGCFEMAATLQLKQDRSSFVNESFANAVLCRIAQGDMVGAQQQAQSYRKLQVMDLGAHNLSSIDVLLEGVFESYAKWSIVALDDAVQRFESVQRLAPWQRHCLVNVRNKIGSADLR